MAERVPSNGRRGVLRARSLVADHRLRDGSTVRALDGVDLELVAGEVVAVMGASGAGKSTLATVLAGVVAPTGGTLDGTAAGNVRLALQRPESGFLAERVLDEVALAARWNDVPSGRADATARDALRVLSVDESLWDADPLALSGGEQRRVAIAAVLAAGGDVLVLDEASAGLDLEGRLALRGALAATAARGAAIVLVTHDPREAAQVADRLVVLAAGRVAWQGAPAQLLADAERSEQVGIAPLPEAALLHRVEHARRAGIAAGAPTPVASPPRPTLGAHALQLPPLVDARPRLLATAAAIAAALVASSLLAAGVVAAACIVATIVARPGATRTRTAVRPIVALGVLLVAMQLLLGGSSEVELRRGVEATAPVLVAVHRVLQVLAIVLATLVLTARTTVADLATALRWLLAPLRLLRVPVDDLALVAATGLGFVPVLADELERLRIAQAARGIRPRGRGPLARLRLESMLLVPLVVIAFQRARTLAEALAVRGLAQGLPDGDWRPRTVPGRDIALAASGMLLVVLARVL